MISGFEYYILPHPLILNLVSSVYKRFHQNGVFTLYVLIDLITNVFLWISYKSSFKKRSEVLSLTLILLNPLSIISVCLLNTNIFWYFFFSFFLLTVSQNRKDDEMFICLAAALISFDFHYLLLILTTVVYYHESLKETIKIIWKISAAYMLLFLGFYYIYHLRTPEVTNTANGIKIESEKVFLHSFRQIIVSLNGEESMGMLWYFYTVWFDNFIPTFWYLIQIFPYSLVIPTVLNVISLRTNARAYNLLPVDTTGELNSKLEEFIKNSKDEQATFWRFLEVQNMQSIWKSALKAPEDNNKQEELEDIEEIYENNEYYLSQWLTLTFIYFMLTKPYLVSFDFIIILPFMWRHWNLFSYSPAALVMVFGLWFTYGGEMLMWIAWQKRMAANVNNYWVQIFINSAVWGFISYIWNSRISQKK